MQIVFNSLFTHFYKPEATIFSFMSACFIWAKTQPGVAVVGVLVI